MAKLTKKKLLSLDPVDIGKMKQAELRQLLRGARQLYKAQSEKFAKYEGKVFSPALESIEDYYEANPQKEIRRMSMGKLRNEIFRLQDFFTSKTSTVPGARAVGVEQDRRIFGINEFTNKPLKRLTYEERTSFWSAYNEFIHMQSEAYVRNMTSDVIQQMLAGMVINSRRKKGDFNFTSGDFRVLQQRLEERKSREEWEMNDYERENSDILSGKRPN